MGMATRFRIKSGVLYRPLQRFVQTTVDVVQETEGKTRPTFPVSQTSFGFCIRAYHGTMYRRTARVRVRCALLPAVAQHVSALCHVF